MTITPNSSQHLVGFGHEKYTLAICIANRPPLAEYEGLAELRPLLPGEIANIVASTSNHWRKIFNVYAKFLAALNTGDIPDWRHYRDTALLQAVKREALLFSAPSFSPSAVHIIAGKTYASELDLPFTLNWLDAHFALNEQHKVIVCPYLDYRQLTNERIDRLTGLVKRLQGKS